MTKLVLSELTRFLLVLPAHRFRFLPSLGWISTPTERSYSLKASNRFHMDQKMSTDNIRNVNDQVVKDENVAHNDDSGEQNQKIMFGKFDIDPAHVFYKSPNQLTFALVNLRPLVPGHVLVVPVRVVPRLKNLSDEEYDDLWRSVRIIQGVLEAYHGASSSNVAVQDGLHAGQSVPHVHVHILPRRGDDYYNTAPIHNDQIYQDLQKWVPNSSILETLIKPNNNEPLEVAQINQATNLAIPQVRRDRTFDEMKEEAALFRRLVLNASQ